MLEEQQPAAGDEHAPHLAQRAGEVVDRAERERRDGGVEARVGERQPLRRRGDDLRREAELGRALAQAPAHRLLRLGEDELLQPRGVVGEVQARPRAELEDPPARAREQRGAPGGEPRGLALGERAVVAAREEPAVEAHASPRGRPEPERAARAS